MSTLNYNNLSAIYINSTLKRSPETSHTQGLMDVSINIMRKEGVSVETVRLIDYDIAPGVQPDMTEAGWETDDWPELVQKIETADILVVGTPIWLGEKSSVAQRLIERLYSMTGQKNDKGQGIYYGKVAGCVITGNEDGIKHCAMGILYSLQHVGFVIPPQADCGWVGPAGPGPSYLDEESAAQDNDFTNKNTTFMTYNLLHLAHILKANNGLPAYGNSKEAWSEGSRWAFNNPEYR